MTIIREYAQGPNRLQYCLPSGGFDPRKHQDLRACALAEMREEVRAGTRCACWGGYARATACQGASPTAPTAAAPHLPVVQPTPSCVHTPLVDTLRPCWRGAAAGGQSS